jgi:hypothetical protein
MTTRPSSPQLQPALTMSGLTNPQLLLLYYEARGELNQPFATNFVSGIERRMDVRVARINPATGVLLAPSAQVSQYRIEANSSPVKLADIVSGLAAVNRENLTVYSGGLAAFFGDYPGASPARPFEYTNGRWRWANDPSTTMTMWTDTRDLEPPLDAANAPSLYGLGVVTPVQGPGKRQGPRDGQFVVPWPLALVLSTPTAHLPAAITKTVGGVRLIRQTLFSQSGRRLRVL